MSSPATSLASSSTRASTWGSSSEGSRVLEMVSFYLLNLKQGRGRFPNWVLCPSPRRCGKGGRSIYVVQTNPLSEWDKHSHTLEGAQPELQLWTIGRPGLRYGLALHWTQGWKIEITRQSKQGGFCVFHTENCEPWPYYDTFLSPSVHHLWCITFNPSCIFVFV